MNSHAVATINRLCDLHNFADGQGFCDTHIDGVRLFRATHYQSNTPLMYDQGIVFIVQGHKVGYLNNVRLEYGPDTYLIIANPSPIECETFASEQAPLLGLYISIDLDMLQELLAQRSEGKAKTHTLGRVVSRGVEAATVSPPLVEALQMLLNVMCSATDSRILGRQQLRALLYRILQGEKGHVLAELIRQDSSFARVSKVVHYLQQNYASKHSVEELAAIAGMSESAFYRAFKQSMTDSPLQYLKKIRLNQAKQQLLLRSVSASAAAFSVGYESAPQFSREFKRYFGVSPSQVAETTSV